MAEMPPRPRGSECEERIGAEGLTITWRRPDPDLGRSYPVGCLVPFLCLWAIGWVFGVFVLVQIVLGQAPNRPDSWGVFPWLVFWTFAGIVLCRWLRLMVQPRRSECITLDGEKSHYDPGTPPIVEKLLEGDRPQISELFVRHPRPVEASQSELSAFRLGSAGTRQRLTFDLNGDRIEIGPWLQDHDRQWLLAVLEEWRSGSLDECISKYQKDHPN